MLESFQVGRSAAFVDACWLEKNALALRALGQPSLRQMRPEVIGDRTRMDLQWNGQALGIFTPGRDFTPVRSPDTCSPTIAAMLTEFSESGFPLTVASLRFRSGLQGERGLWIDAANEDIKSLLDEKNWLMGRLERGWVVEIGQKRKHVARTLKLEPAPALCWLPSFDANNDEIPLRSHIALFSQPGPEVNRALIAAGFELLDEASLEQCTWAEWGAGYGNLSAAFASRLGTRAWSSEVDEVASNLLAQNAQEFFAGVQTGRARAETSPAGFAAQAQLWIVDPPRSGFAELFRTLVGAEQRPRHVLAYHCHSEGLTKDTHILREAGYKLLAWSSVDAFPATPHHEVISIWRL
ncbi:MAG: hypothetical protein JST16_07190 [Bdellovibrionales bacterium]|nr:hypothetical protein [Bdellovibrionales bacterium]